MKKAFINPAAALILPAIVLCASLGTDYASALASKAAISDALIESAAILRANEGDGGAESGGGGGGESAAGGGGGESGESAASLRAKFIAANIAAIAEVSSQKTDAIGGASGGGTSGNARAEKLIINLKTPLAFLPQNELEINYQIGAQSTSRLQAGADYVFALALSKSANDEAVLKKDFICSPANRDIIPVGLCHTQRAQIIDAYQTLIALMIKMAQRHDEHGQNRYGFVPYGAGVQLKGADLARSADAANSPAAAQFAEQNYVLWPIDIFGYELRSFDDFSRFYPTEELSGEFLREGVRENRAFSIIPSLRAAGQNELAAALSNDAAREFILSKFEIKYQNHLPNFAEASAILRKSFATQQPFGRQGADGELIINAQRTLELMAAGEAALSYRLWDPRVDGVDLAMSAAELEALLERKNAIASELAAIAAMEDIVRALPDEAPSSSGGGGGGGGAGGGGGGAGGGSGGGGGVKYDDLDAGVLDEFRAQAQYCHDDNYYKTAHSFTRFCIAAAANAGGEYSEFSRFEPEDYGEGCYFNDTSNEFLDLLGAAYVRGEGYASAALADCAGINLPQNGAGDDGDAGGDAGGDGGDGDGAGGGDGAGEPAAQPGDGIDFLPHAEMLMNCNYDETAYSTGGPIFQIITQIIANAEPWMAEYAGAPYYPVCDGGICYLSAGYMKFAESLAAHANAGNLRAREVFNECHKILKGSVIYAQSASFYAQLAAAKQAESAQFYSGWGDLLGQAASSYDPDASLREQISALEAEIADDYMGKMIYENCSGYVDNPLYTPWPQATCEMFSSYEQPYIARLQRLSELKAELEAAGNGVSKQALESLASRLNDAANKAEASAELERLKSELNAELASIASSLESAVNVRGMGLCNSFLSFVQGSSCQQNSARQMKFFERPLAAIATERDIASVPLLSQEPFWRDAAGNYIGSIAAAQDHASIGLIRAVQMLAQSGSNRLARVFVLSTGSNEATDGALAKAGLCERARELLAREGKELEIIAITLGMKRSDWAHQLTSLEKYKKIWSRCGAKIIAADEIDWLLKSIAEQAFGEQVRYFFAE